MIAIAGVAVVAILICLLVITGINKRDKEKEESVVVRVRFDTKACSPDFPLHVTITNGGSNAISEVTWYFAAYRAGYSSNLVESYSGSRNAHAASDKILGRGESYSVCYKAPTIKGGAELDQLEWKAELKSVRFKP